MSHPSVTPPIVSELEAIFQTLPDSDLLALLIGPRRRGRPGYKPVILWRCFVAYYVLGLPSVSDLLRTLRNNPYIAQACGINSPAEIPSQPTLSRFGTRLARQFNRTAVRNVHRELTRIMFRRLPNFGKSVAIDSTDVKAWSNGGKHYRGKHSDPDAGWIVKSSTEGRKKFRFGHKVHILCDTEYEMPIAIKVTPGNTHDVNEALPLLQQARYTYGPFHPDYVICDAGYSSQEVRQQIKRQYLAEPIIDPNPSHKKAFARTPKTPEWKAIYARRTAVERINGRLKAHRKLDFVRVRGRHKVMIHALLSTITMQARALAFPQQPRQSVSPLAA